jgi:tetratricopeptide (TPR) repeat protein
MDLFDNRIDAKEKVDLLTGAMDKLNDGQALLSEEDFSQRIRLDSLYDRIFKSVVELDFVKALRIADDLASIKEGKGYYLLANRFYFEGDRPEALKYVEKALACDKFPINALLLKMKLDISSENPPYESLLRLADKPVPIDKETWETAYYKGIIYTVNGFPNAAHRFFSMSKKMCPKDRRTKIFEYWKEAGQPKIFKGKIMSDLTENVGNIYDHRIKGCDELIFFDPRSKRNDVTLDVGMDVQFELGFNSLGVVAISVKPIDENQTKIETFTKEK